MARVLSRFVHDAGDRLEAFGVAPVALSRALYIAAIAGYIAKVAYPALAGSKKKDEHERKHWKDIVHQKKKRIHVTKEELEVEEAVKEAHIISHAGWCFTLLTRSTLNNHFHAEEAKEKSKSGYCT